jgi:CRISPR-associated protein Csd1
MILQALNEFYQRKYAEGELPPLGFEFKEIPFLIVIDSYGEFLSLEDTREIKNGRLVGKTFEVPTAKQRSGSNSYMTANFLWDHIGYVLGVPKDQDKRSVELAKKQHNTWLDSINKLPDGIKQLPEVVSIINFYRNNGVQKVLEREEMEECRTIPGCNITFRLNTEHSPVPASLNLRNYVIKIADSSEDSSEAVIGFDIVTGEKGEIVRLHRKTRIDKDADSLVSFQKSSGYDSYGKEQGYNAPVTKNTEFAYTTALNYLLKSKKHRILVGETHTVFWGSKRNELEEKFSLLFEEPEHIDPDSNISVVRELFFSIRSGAYIKEDDDIYFYVLGLSPNSHRISVRFWERGTVKSFSNRIRQYFEDFSITGDSKTPEYYPLQTILANISVLDKFENIPPLLTGEVMKAILSGTPYPASMLQMALNRIRSDVTGRATRIRVAAIKAYINRYYSFYPKLHMKEIGMELDTEQRSVGYNLGRLFATLERIQESASPNLNSTIRERYYGSACTSPASVFPTLLRLKNHHLAKIETKGLVTWLEQKLGDIMENLNGFPPNLNIHEQGMFSIGYYHQRQTFFKKKEENSYV